MRERMMGRIIKILREREHDLSDGYGYYCGGDEFVDKKLYEITSEIVDAVEEEGKR